MQVEETRNDDTVQLTVTGRVDTTTAPQLQEKILAAFQKGKHLVVDFAGVDYISSAGLRALLLGQKTSVSKGGTMKIRNVKSSVQQVLDMSGFSKILKIE